MSKPNILYIDIDTLRPDHLGCYGYHRDTSPNFDRLAGDGVRFTNCFVSDSPCLPSRSALSHGRFGIHTGAINHGGAWADPLREGPTRDFVNSGPYSQWVTNIRAAGYETASVSSFAGRHNSWWWLAGFNRVYDCGKAGGENADEVTGEALDMLDTIQRSGKPWFLHFNLWDPHTPYRVPQGHGNPFENDPPPDWFNPELIERYRKTYGTHSCNIPLHQYSNSPLPREVATISTMDDYKHWVDGYDTGIHYADHYVGKILARLDELGLYDSTAIIFSSDHGENMGELNVFGDHQLADYVTNRVPLIIKWPGITPGVNEGCYYQLDMGTTVLDLLDHPIPEKWDGISFKRQLQSGDGEGRDKLVLSHAPWSCQRSLYKDNYLLIKSYLDGLKDLPEYMLFNIAEDPHELNNLIEQEPERAERMKMELEEWIREQLDDAGMDFDPMEEVVKEGGPYHTRGWLRKYIDAYTDMGEPEIARRMKEKYENNPAYT